MDIPFKVDQELLHRNGFIEKAGKQGEYIKKMGILEYPRLHVILSDNGPDNIHIDLKRKHGSFMRFIYGGRTNIIQSNDTRIDKEVMKLKLELYHRELTKMANRVKQMKNNLK